jgi:feruloyl esterase
VWHGSADATVKPMNAGEIIKQWTNVHGLRASPSRSDKVDGFPHRVWTNAAGEEVIEEFVITGMAHGTPLAVGDEEDSYGAAGPFLLDVGISSSYQIAKFWGLTGQSVGAVRSRTDAKPTREDAKAARLCTQPHRKRRVTSRRHGMHMSAVKRLPGRPSTSTG